MQQTQEHGIIETAEVQERAAIQCGNKLLARVCFEGVLFWCKEHKAWELRTWGELIGALVKAR